jgi:phosphoserine aminotransferase
MSILEISHRSKAFEAILARLTPTSGALAAFRANYKVLFLQGGASLQFSMVPMNLLGPRAPPTTSTAARGRQGHQGGEEGRHAST